MSSKKKLKTSYDKKNSVFGKWVVIGLHEA